MLLLFGTEHRSHSRTFTLSNYSQISGQCTETRNYFTCFALFGAVHFAFAVLLMTCGHFAIARYFCLAFRVRMLNMELKELFKNKLIQDSLIAFSREYFGDSESAVETTYLNHVIIFFFNRQTLLVAMLCSPHISTVSLSLADVRIQCNYPIHLLALLKLLSLENGSLKLTNIGVALLQYHRTCTDQL